MNKNKIPLAAVLIIVIIAAALALSACSAGNKETPTKVPATDTPAEIPTELPTELPTEAPTEAPTEEPTEKPTKEPPASGTNVALNADVEVSSTTGSVHVQWGWAPEYINDGRFYDPDPDDPSVGWTTAVGVNTTDPDQEEWVIFTLAQNTAVNKIIIYPVVGGNHFPESFKVMVSADGNEYTTVGEVNDNTRAADKDDTPFTFEFDAVNCRYVQFLATKLYSVPSTADGFLCQVAEIEIYAA
jgi:hypothetical protein